MVAARKSRGKCGDPPPNLEPTFHVSPTKSSLHWMKVWPLLSVAHAPVEEH